VSDIAVHLGLSRPATSQMIDKLAGRRLVLRTEDAADRRQRNIVLSAVGRALVNRIAAARAARFNASLEVLDSAVAARFRSILEEVIARLDARTPTPARPAPTRSRKG
jgi:DNA-binding MarR family transcriptional regulator